MFFSVAFVYLGFKQFNSEMHTTEYMMDTELTCVGMSTCRLASEVCLPSREALVSRSDVPWRTGVPNPHGNSKATVGVVLYHMFLFSMGEGHRGKREIASYHGDTKHMVLCH